MIFRFVVAAAAVVLTGCVTDLTPEEIYGVPTASTERVLSGEMGGLIVDLRLGRTCNQLVTVTYRNLETSETVTKTMTPSYSRGFGSVEAAAAPFVLVVPPGRYVFDRGRCVHSDASYIYTTSLDALAIWLKPVQVDTGKIAYGGSPSGERVSHEFGIALTPMEKFSGRTTRSSDHYWLYTVTDRSEQVHQELSRYNPRLAERLTVNVGGSLMDKEIVRQIIANAYQIEAPDVAADDAEAAQHRKAAKARVMTDMTAYLAKRLKEEFMDDAPAKMLNFGDV